MTSTSISIFSIVFMIAEYALGAFDLWSAWRVVFAGHITLCIYAGVEFWKSGQRLKQAIAEFEESERRRDD